MYQADMDIAMDLVGILTSQSIGSKWKGLEESGPFLITLAQ